MLPGPNSCDGDCHLPSATGDATRSHALAATLVFS